MPDAIIRSIRGADQDKKTKEWYFGDGDVADFTDKRGKQLLKMYPSEVSLWGSDAEIQPAPKKTKKTVQGETPADLA
jgi:hypothetical protein